MNKIIHKLMLLIVTGVFFTSSLAITKPDEDPINLFSDSVTYNRAEQTINYHGHVKLTQGTTELNGDNMTVYQQNQHHHIDKVVIHGTPAHFSFSMDDKTPVKGQAKTILFEPETKKLTLEGNVHIQHNPETIIHDSGGAH